MAPEQPRGSVRQIGGFELLSQLGRGGMGAVFKARQVSLDRFLPSHKK